MANAVVPIPGEWVIVREWYAVQVLQQNGVWHDVDACEDGPRMARELAANKVMNPKETYRVVNYVQSVTKEEYEKWHVA